MTWRKQFIQTLLERDFPQWGVRVPAAALLRFWTMLAHYHGQIWNASEPARALGVNPSTTRRYLDLLTDAMMLRQLKPWYVNLRKRQVKSPKVYVRDSGLLHQLPGIDRAKGLLSHPKIGASWEGFVIEQVLASELHDEAWFWATHQGGSRSRAGRYHLSRQQALRNTRSRRSGSPGVTCRAGPAIRPGGSVKFERHIGIDYWKNHTEQRLHRRAGLLSRQTVTQVSPLA